MTRLWTNHADSLAAAAYESPRVVCRDYGYAHNQWPNLRDCVRAMANYEALLLEAIDEHMAEAVHFVPTLALPADCGADVSSGRVTNRSALVTCAKCRDVAKARVAAMQPVPMTLDQYFAHYGCD